MLTLKFKIVLKSNYHSGAGYGKGFGLDSALLREADGTPVLRGTTLAGLLRNGAYRLLSLPPLQKYKREQVIDRLFGTPSQPKRWHISSARPEDLPNVDAQAVQRVRIDPRTRRAEPRKLFSLEEGIAGLEFHFTVTWDACDEATLDDAAFLVAAARNVRQLGRSRRRGLGECVIHLVEASGIADVAPDSWEDWFLDRFKRVWLEGSPTLPQQKETKTHLVNINAGSVSKETAVRVRLIVRLDEPVLIAQRSPAGNQYEASPFIPGQAVLGALAHLAASQNDLSDTNNYKRFVTLFRRGGIAFSPLYPAHEYNNNLYSAIPAPLGLLTCSVVPFEGNKKGHGIWPAYGAPQECPECKSRLEPVSGFVILKQKNPYTLQPALTSELHIQVNEQTGRVESGQLYGYTVLTAGQYFVGELVCTDEVTWNRLKEMTGITEKTPLTWRLGKARRRGYGKVTVWMEQVEDELPLWMHQPLSERVTDLTQPISMTLLTDTIIPDPWGREVIGFDEGWLESTLGLGPLEIVDAYARTRIVDSFNATLGLPRWRDTALSAGSVVWFRLEQPPTDWQDRMERLEAEGIGLRRHEGYGWIAFNHPVYEQRENVQWSFIRLTVPMRPPSGRGKDLFMEYWEERLEGLEEVLTKRKDTRFIALARWLHAHCHESPHALQEKLTKITDSEHAFGQPERALIEAIGKEEYGTRSKENFFTTKGRDAMEAVIEALQWLENEEQGNWRRGIELMADKIAALARDEGGAQ